MCSTWSVWQFHCLRYPSPPRRTGLDAHRVNATDAIGMGANIGGFVDAWIAYLGTDTARAILARYGL